MGLHWSLTLQLHIQRVLVSGLEVLWPLQLLVLCFWRSPAILIDPKLVSMRFPVKVEGQPWIISCLCVNLWSFITSSCSSRFSTNVIISWIFLASRSIKYSLHFWKTSNSLWHLSCCKILSRSGSGLLIASLNLEN